MRAHLADKEWGGRWLSWEFFWHGPDRRMWGVVVELQPCVHVWVCIQDWTYEFLRVCAHDTRHCETVLVIFFLKFFISNSQPIRSDSNRKSSSLNTSILVCLFRARVQEISQNSQQFSVRKLKILIRFLKNNL